MDIKTNIETLKELLDAHDSHLKFYQFTRSLPEALQLDQMLEQALNSALIININKKTE
ncbi:MAG: hypothetical protein ACI82E_001475 [Nonlabens sp.]